jgi:CDP-diglyceride synthetase
VNAPRRRPGEALAIVGRAVAAVLVAAWLALVEVFWLPLRVAGVLVPVSVVAAVFGNLLLVGLALRLTGSRLIAVLPALTWVAVVVAAMIRRPEGDLVLSGRGALGVVNLVFLLLGVTAAAFAVGRALGSPARPAQVSPGSTPEPAPHPAGSGSGGAR